MSSTTPRSQNYTVSNVATNSQLIRGFLPSYSQAAARATLRHQKFGDQTEYVTRRRIVGLHPMYFAFRDSAGSVDDLIAGDKLLKDTLIDIFDAITTLDRLDGGITLLVRCPGYCVPSGFSVEDIAIDAYVSPREIAFGGPKTQEAVALIIQKFGEDMVLSHLRRFTDRSQSEGIPDTRIPRSAGKSFSVNGLPDFEREGNGYMRCQCGPATALAQSTTTSSSTNPMNRARSATQGATASSSTNLTNRAHSVTDSSGRSAYPSHGNNSELSTMAIISIGPNTDAIADQLGLPDSSIVQLRNMTCTVRSSRWPQALRGPEWGLNREQSIILSKALLADIEKSKYYPEPNTATVLDPKIVILSLLVSAFSGLVVVSALSFL